MQSLWSFVETEGKKKHMTRIKLCGLTEEREIEYVNQLLPEYIGFVFVKHSKRYVSMEQAKCLSQMLDKRIVPVGVFVDEEPENIIPYVEMGIVRAVQLHGSEDAVYIRKLTKLLNSKVKKPCTIIKAFRIDNMVDICTIQNSKADYVLLDSGGGSGKTFDWSMLTQINRPYFLAGGLTPANVGAAVKQFRPYGVDASSSLETDGKKNIEKMTAFIKAVREEKNE